MKYEITFGTNDLALYEAFQQFIATIDTLHQAHAKAREAGTESPDFELQMRTKEPMPKSTAPRPTVHYTAIFPEGLDKLQTKSFIDSMTRGFGGKAFRAKVWYEVATATLEGRQALAREMEIKLNDQSKNVQRELVKLRQAGLVKSEPIIVPAAE